MACLKQRCPRGIVLFGFLFCAAGTALLQAADAEKKPTPPTERYAAEVLKDSPIAWWRFSETEGTEAKNALTESGISLTGQRAGTALKPIDGPRPAEFPLFNSHNQAVQFTGAGQYYRVVDQGEKSPLDFDDKDSITLEAWVKPDRQSVGGHSYIISKGRTKSGGTNQNYALRLTSSKGGMAISFLFHSRGESGTWHRWTSTTSMPIGDGWHHVAVAYTFGNPKSLRGYLDGEAVKGAWDMGGASAKAPVVDDDELWIGSSMGGSPSSTFHGAFDEVAIYRAALSAERIKAHFKYVPPQYVFDRDRIPQKGVLVDLFEGIPDRKSWNFRPPRLVESYEADAFGFIDLPRKYSDKGVRIDRSNPCLLQAVGRVVIPAGEQRILVRSRNAARVYLDEKLIAETPFHKLGGDNGPIFEIDVSQAPHLRALRRGDSESIVTITGDGKQHTMRLEMFVGGGGRRPELGECGVFVAAPGEDFRLLGSPTPVMLTDAGWSRFAQNQKHVLEAMNDRNRRSAGPEEAKYWAKRHELARHWVQQQAEITIPDVSKKMPVQNEIDRFIGQKLEEAGETPAPLSDDLAFLRRITLDVTGRIPKPAEIEQYLKDPAAQRRNLVIDRLLASDEWADQWIPYWQDVLAENPNILNPTLNNTGPFRFWIEESFRDNKPFDRFVTELVMMEGSTYFGGPAGFEMATQNDAPMAAKAHIVGEAFLAVEMKCARCHDAPYHDLKQRDLFSIAAMLARESQSVPPTSTVPNGSNSSLIRVTLKPGEQVSPEWPFAAISSGELLGKIVRRPEDSRERLAALLTSPTNDRFAKVIVNRFWQRYFGRGLVEPADDWEYADPSHPELLEFLSRDFVSNGYDLKHLARLMFRSHAYQRTPVSRDVVQSDKAYLFAAPLQRRMTAEQVVDSLFVASGKPFDADVMNIDIDTSRSYKSSLNLGEPERAWEFASLSNERDRPSLSLPFAQPFVTTLETFGWRPTRQDPLTIREGAPSPLQPAELANGLLSRRTCTLSEDSAFTALAMSEVPVEQLVDQVYARVLTRQPSVTERELFVELLKPGYNDRRHPDATVPPRVRLPRFQVAWTNHLNPEATNIKQRLEDEVRRGDPPTPRLSDDWRQRLEDMLWALVNSPEFVFVP